MLQQHLVDLSRRDLLAAAVDHLLQSADQRKVAFRVDKPLVAGPKPTVGEGLGVRLGIVGVAAGHAGPLDHDLTGSAHREQVTIRVHDRDLYARLDTDRSSPPLARRQRVGRHLMRGLRHPIRLEHRRAELRFQLAHRLRRKG